MEQQINSTASQKEIAVSFLQLAASGNVREAFSRYIEDGFRHHNPYFLGDADSLMNAMEQSANQSPNKTIVIKQAIQEKDTVAVHSHVKQNPDDAGAAVVHIFRFQNKRIVEMWDIGQPIPDDSPNENSVF